MNNNDIKIIAADVIPSTRKERKAFGEGCKIEILWEKKGKPHVLYLIYNLDGSWDFDGNGNLDSNCFEAIEKWINAIVQDE